MYVYALDVSMKYQLTVTHMLSMVYTLSDLNVYFIKKIS